MQTKLLNTAPNVPIVFFFFFQTSKAFSINPLTANFENHYVTWDDLSYEVAANIFHIMSMLQHFACKCRIIAKVA